MAVNELKQTISLRMEDSARAEIQAVAARLFVRESDVYRFAISYMLKKFSSLLDESCVGCDLLPALLTMRTEMNQLLAIRKHQLENIINGKNISSDKYVAMADIELLLLPRHLLKASLMKMDKVPKKNIDPEEWLRLYLSDKYKFSDSFKNTESNSVIDIIGAEPA